MELKEITKDKSKYLQCDYYINFDNKNIRHKADEICEGLKKEEDIIKAVFTYVRDEIKHSYDVKSHIVTTRASEVLEKKVGICFAKSTLLAALLRYKNIPCGFSYQRLSFNKGINNKYCIHALNAVYLNSYNRWMRIDSRGNKEGVNAQFFIDKEQLAFNVDKTKGEIDYKEIYYTPNEKTIKALMSSDDMMYIYYNNLPDKL